MGIRLLQTCLSYVILPFRYMIKRGFICSLDSVCLISPGAHRGRQAVHRMAISVSQMLAAAAHAALMISFLSCFHEVKVSKGTVTEETQIQGSSRVAGEGSSAFFRVVSQCCRELRLSMCVICTKEDHFVRRSSMSRSLFLCRVDHGGRSLGAFDVVLDIESPLQLVQCLS